MEGIHLKLMKMLKRRLFEMGVLDMATRKKTSDVEEHIQRSKL